MTEAERSAVIDILRLFTLYELRAGSDYWLGRFMKTFKRPELQRMAATFGFFELSVHKPFYAKLNEVLSLSTDEFFLGYHDDPELEMHMKFIGDMIKHENPLISLAAFSMVEGAVLYSSFAFLKHFQSAGKNKLMNVVRGINFSVRDEQIHSEAGAKVFKTLLDESELSDVDHAAIDGAVHAIAESLWNHEQVIIKKIFSHGDIEGITEKQVLNFVQSRINVCMRNLGYNNIFDVKYNPISDWFYDGVSGFMFNDTFSGIGNSYVRNWDEEGFVYEEYKRDEE
jgi:ribonucleotide reductase beta subunit family protein with ferritin-like domain